MSALSYVNINNSGPAETIINIPAVLTSYATDANIEVRQQFGNLLCQILNKQSLEDILTHIHELIAAILIVSEDKFPTVRASLVEQIPHIFQQCHEHACPDLEHYLYDRLLQIVLNYLQDEENEVSISAYSVLQILLDKYVLDKKRIEEKVCPAIICPIRNIHCESLKGFNINSIMLMGRITPIIGPEKCEELFLNHYIELCKCKVNSVRKACVAIFPTICYVLGTKVTEYKLLDLFFQLCTDSFWGVRKACAESIALISLICSPDCRRNRIAPIVLKLAKDSNTWVTSATFKILGQFISSFAQPCVTGLAYSYKGELTVTNPVDPDFRIHSDPQTLANYVHYLNMFKCSEHDETNSNLNSSDESLTSIKKINFNSKLCNETPKTIAQMIIENKTKLTKQITEYAWPKQNYFKNYYLRDCSKYIDLDSGNANAVDNSGKNNNYDQDDFVSELFDDDSNKNETNTKILTENTKILTDAFDEIFNQQQNEVKKQQELQEQQQFEQQQQQEQFEQQQQQQQEQTNNSNTTSSDDSNIFDNMVCDSDNSNLESNLHRRRYRRVYSFWRKNKPSDLQSIIKKAIQDARQDNIKPPLPPPPPHPLKLPSKSSSPLTIGPSNTEETLEQKTSDAQNNLQNQSQDQQKESESIPIETSLLKIFSFLSKNSENAHKNDSSSTVVNINQNSINSGDIKNSNQINDSMLDNKSVYQSNEESGIFNSSTITLKDKRDNNGNEEDEDIFNEYNSYKFWHVSPEMPLDLNIVGNVGTWNMQMLYDTLPTSNSSMLDDDIVTKTTKFKPPSSFEQNIVPPDVLEAYVTMVMYKEDDEIPLTCAYNFPAVLLTLGRSNWEILKSLLQYLCDDIDWKVRKTIALSINFLALILGREIATRDLVPVYLGFFKDLDEVKIEAIRNFSSFLKVIDKSKHEEILSNIGICLRCDSKTNWRIKEDLAKEVCLVIKMYDSMQNCDIILNLTSLTGYFLEDKVSCVREIAADAMAEIIRISNPIYREAIVKHFLVDEFANSSRWRNRQTFLNVLYKYNVLMCSKIIAKRLSIKQSDTQQLTKSPSTTSTSSDTAAAENNIKDVIYILHLIFPSIEKLSVDFVPNIRLLVAKYIVFIINVNGISDDLYENVLKIVRRLRHDQDLDVRETFDAVDLLKNEVDEQSFFEQQQQQKKDEQQVEQIKQQEEQSKEKEKEQNNEQSTNQYQEKQKMENEVYKTNTDFQPTLTYSAILKGNLDNPSVSQTINDEKSNETTTKQEDSIKSKKDQKDTNLETTTTTTAATIPPPPTTTIEDSREAILTLTTMFKKYLEKTHKKETPEQKIANDEKQEQKLIQNQSVESTNETDDIVKLPDAIVTQSQI